VKRLIGLTGHKGAGKDSVAEILARHGYERMAFADPLKQIAAAIGWDGSKEDRGHCLACGMLQGRRLLQVLGTEGVRENIADDAWLIAAERTLARHELAVITDVRFLNEAAWVREHGGTIWRVVRPNHHGDDHPSEREQGAIRADHHVHNEGTLSDLELAVVAELSAASQLF